MRTLGDQLPPLGRVGQVSDIVDAILYLESAPYVTGEVLHVDSGQVAGHEQRSVPPGTTSSSGPSIRRRWAARAVAACAR